MCRPLPVVAMLQTFHPASPLSVAAFAGVCVAVVLFLCLGVAASARREGTNLARRLIPVLIVTGAWLGLCAAMVASGWNAKGPRHLMLFFAAIVLVSAVAGLSTLGGWLSGASLRWLVGFQAFRLPLELILHSWTKQGVIPHTMTWTGANWDIIAGILALGLAPMADKNRRAGWFANIVGLGLLANVGRVALLSSAVPFGWDVTPKLQLANHLPYAMILPVCVGGALVGHVALTRALIRTDKF